jgi:hypothetical protein
VAMGWLQRGILFCKELLGGEGVHTSRSTEGFF